MADFKAELLNKSSEPNQMRSKLIGILSTNWPVYIMLSIYGCFLTLYDTVAFLVSFCLAWPTALLRLIFGTNNCKSVKNEVVVITGAGSGIGKALALHLAACEATVVCWDISRERVDNTVHLIRSFGWKAYPWVVDVSDEKAVKKAAQEVEDEIGKVCIVVNNAGIMPCKRFQDYTTKEIRRVMDVNVNSYFWTVKAFLPQMLVNQRGHIVSIASLGSYCGSPNLVPYCATQAAINGFMNALQLELRFQEQHYVKFTTVLPFIINTGMIQKPRVRYPKLLTMMDPNDAAVKIIEGIMREEPRVWIPRRFKYCHYVMQMLPREVCLTINDHMDVLCEAHDPWHDGGWREAILKGEPEEQQHVGSVAPVKSGLEE